MTDNFEHDSVAILKHVPDHIYRDLPEDECDAIRRAIGKTVTIVQGEDYMAQLTEVEFRDQDNFHTIWVEPSCLERLPEEPETVSHNSN